MTATLAGLLIVTALVPAGSSPEGLRYAESIASVVAQPFRAATEIPGAPDCVNWSECRQLALEAAERREFETFHDLAWRAVQLGPKDDPSLLFLLARAQSLSGRPHDALVMLRRLAPSGAAHDALASPDFDRVRRLREWPEVAALVTSRPEVADETRPETAAAVPSRRAAATPSPVRERATPPIARDAPAITELSKPAAEPAKAAGPPVAEALTFDAASFKPAALAYDVVSRRFIISDTDVSRLAVIDEFSHQVATLASGQSAGFATVTAIAIDPRAGDLWVASVDGSSGSDVPALYKLQLISGRVLKQFATASLVAGRFTDMTVTRDGTVVAIDDGGRILRLGPRSKALDVVARVEEDTLSSVAVAVDGTIYVAGTSGVLHVRGGRATPMSAPKGVDLSGLERIRWSRGSLVALQRAGDSGYRVIRARVGRDGSSIARVSVLDGSVETPSPTAATLSGDVFYYLAETAGPHLAIRRLVVR